MIEKELQLQLDNAMEFLNDKSNFIKNPKYIESVKSKEDNKGGDVVGHEDDQLE